MIKLGTKVTDSLDTGFGGIAVTRTEFLHGCVRIGIQPVASASESGESKNYLMRLEYLDEIRLKENDPATTPPQHPILGLTVTEPHSTLVGMAVARSEYLFGGPRIGIQPPGLFEGHPLDQLDVDEAQIKDIAELRRIWAQPVPEQELVGATAAKSPKKPGGGPRDMAPRREIAPRN